MFTSENNEYINNTVKQVIAAKLEQNSVNIRFPNRIPRDEIFDLLDQFCTIIYYPIKDEKNNGFHKSYRTGPSRTDEQFVYINTAKQNCLQVFTAAHELGHIWNIVDEIRSADRENRLIDVKDEEIVNKFAAELLMPEEYFVKAYNLQYEELITKGRNSGESVLKLIAELMNTFFAPQNAVIKRLNELDLINKRSYDNLIEAMEEESINDALHKIIDSFGYHKLIECSERKWVGQLPNLLNKVKCNKQISERKIKEIQGLFGFSDKMLEPIDTTGIEPVMFQGR